VARHGKSKLVENILILALLGILAGAAGGIAIGLVSQRSSSSSSSSHWLGASSVLVPWGGFSLTSVIRVTQPELYT